MELEYLGKGELREGDVVELYPHNRTAEVDFMLDYFKMLPNDKICFGGIDYTILELLTQRLNISDILNYYFFVSSHYKL
jgi:sulfite reductase alpha subunit-like flavoprotein